MLVSHFVMVRVCFYLVEASLCMFLLQVNAFVLSLGPPSSTPTCRSGLKLIRPITHNWASRWSYLLSAVQVLTTTYCRFYREQQFSPAVHTVRFSIALYLKTNYLIYFFFSWICSRRPAIWSTCNTSRSLCHYKGFLFIIQIWLTNKMLRNDELLLLNFYWLSHRADRMNDVIYTKEWTSISI
jgi:hypothetical protein